jgi:hypothetical protein
VDGYIRIWDMDALDNADIVTEALEPIEITPLQEIRINDTARVYFSLL